MSTQIDSLLLDTRDTLHKWLSLATGVLMVFFCFFNIALLHQITIGLVDALFGLLNLYLFRAALQGKSRKWHHYMLIGSLTVTVFYAFYSSDLRAGSIYWLLILPPLYCLLAGPKLGIVYTVILSLPAITFLFIKSDIDHFIPHRSVLNFSLAYFLTYAICFLYETQYKKSSQILHRMAFEDPLTGAKNRHALKVFFDFFNKQTKDALKEKFYQEIDETRLLIIDIDHFKSINDEFGHDVGDAVLIEMTELLQWCTDNHHVYRIGGEEFLIIQNGSQDQAYHFAESIRKRVENHIFRTHRSNIRITVSIGIAELKIGQTFAEFLRAADKNLYSAKSKGRNLVHHSAISLTEAV
ncbi:GGDEF domain-containing protein [Marinomonas profundimaris]|uniref:diguanylate cyclase n=1 Tax=Marinomonas profundimaris TaxID=1208321 RepID=W1RR75_9GAMM|nr:GGDEF domain-containing protein [Marinomonas profundimaris]ETI59195.1 diguanylate cyclase [Marinomonas profundimaris]